MSAHDVKHAERKRAPRKHDAETLAGDGQSFADGVSGVFVEIAINVARQHWPLPVYAIGSC